MACSAAVACAAAAAPPPQGANDPERVIELPPFIVADSRQPWRYVAGSRFEVLARCSDQVTRAFCERYERLLQLLDGVLPPNFRGRSDVPDTILLVDEKLVSKLSADVLARFDAERAGRSGAATTRDARGERSLPGSENRADAPRIEFLRNVALNDLDCRAVLALVDESAFNAEALTFSDDYIRYVLERRVPALPPWFVEGFTTEYQCMHFGANAVDVSPAVWVNDIETAALRKDVNRLRALIPLPELLEGDLPRDGTPDGLALWRSEAALLVRWALDPKHETRRDSFWRYVSRASTGRADELVLQEALGTDYVDLFDQLNAYIPVSVQSRFTLRPQKLGAIHPPAVRNATAPEVARIKGDLERLVVGLVRSRSPQYVPAYESQARRTIETALAAGIADPQVIASLGLLDCDEQRNDEALGLLKRAADAGVVRPRVYFELARLRYAAAVAHPEGQGGLLSIAQTNFVLEPLASGRTHRPPLDVNYRLAAEVWARNGAVLSDAHFAFLDEGLRFFPGDVTLMVYAAALRAKCGFAAEALALLDRAAVRCRSAAELRAVQKVRALVHEPGGSGRTDD
jgi:hypothetical protein